MEIRQALNADWFGRYRRDLGINPTVCDFNVSRHHMETKLSDVGGSDRISDWITGHAAENVGATYGKTDDLTALNYFDQIDLGVKLTKWKATKMKMLDDIIDGAVDDTVLVAALLRKCLVLADRLKNEKLKQWVLSELNGYPDRDELPEYRVLNVNAVGTFLGTFSRQINNQPLPAAPMKDQHKHWATKAYLTQPIAAYESLNTKKNQQSDTLAIAWPGDLVAFYQTAWFPDQGFTLNRAHQIIPVSGLTALVDTVRNKLLQLALELRNQIGSDDPTPQNPPPAVVEREVVQIIYGQINVHGGGLISGDINQAVSQTVIKGDFNSLSQTITELGVPEAHHKGLKTALDADQQAGHTTEIGPQTQGWMSVVR